jgi:hypothetical protein
MSTVQSPSWALSPTERKRLRQEVDAWFAEHGVPQFADRYSAKDRLRFLILPLTVLVAFEIGAAPKLPPTLVPLLVVPPVVVALMAWARPFVLRLLGHKDGSDLNAWRLVGLLLVLGVLSVLLWRSDWPSAWSDAWVDFGVILLAELASMALFTRDVWIGNAERLARPRRWLIACTIGAVIVFSLLLTLDEGAVVDSRQLLNDLVPGDLKIPIALPALVCMMAILTFSDRMSRAAGPSEGDASTASTAVAACFPAVPLLVLVLAAQTTFLREAHELGWARVWLPLGSILILFALSAAGSLILSRQDDSGAGTPTDGRVAWNRIIKGAGNPLFVTVLLATSLIGYPMLVGRDLGIHSFGWNLWGGAATSLMFAIYFPYFAFVGLSVWLGFDRVAVWVGRELRRDPIRIVRGVAGGLPTLLGFAAFFALTAETWEVVVETSRANFILLVGLLVALTLVVLVVLAIHQLSQAQEQPEAQESSDEAWEKTWDRLRKQARRKEPSTINRAPDAIDQLFNSAPSESADLSPQLTMRMRINALLVIGVYQALVFVPVGIGALILFWWIGRLAVSEEVAAQWIYGDNAGPEAVDKIAALSFLGEPWTRVPLLLAAFSVLYLTVTLLTSKDQHEYFFSAANAALRQRLAVRIAYRLRLCGPEPAVGNEEGASAAAAPPQPQPAVIAQAPSP